MTGNQTRCPWSTSDPQYVIYHDNEWGLPNHDDQHLFEMLSLEGAQAGLSWITILRKRNSYRDAFSGFEAELIARYDTQHIEQLLVNPGIVRNRLKIESVINNARMFLNTQDQFGTFNSYIWQFVNGKAKQNAWKDFSQTPTHTIESNAMSRDLKRRGFKFVGPTICYAFMQATGMVNDHLVDCFRHHEVQRDL